MSEKLNIYQRMLKVQKDVVFVKKENRGGLKFKTVTHDQVVELCRKSFMKHGIHVSASLTDHEVEVVRSQKVKDGKSYEAVNLFTKVDLQVSFVNVDNPEDRIEVVMGGHGIDPQDKGIGKAISYGKKYAILTALLLETGDDPDKENLNYSDEDPPPPKHWVDDKETLAAFYKFVDDNGITEVDYMAALGCKEDLKECKFDKATAKEMLKKLIKIEGQLEPTQQ
jgi:hypothetical protein